MLGKKLLTQERLREVLSYSPDTGLFTWRIKISNIKAEDIAGTHNTAGYVVIRVDDKLHYAHRLAFLYMDGYLPENEVDHMDNVKNNNRWNNLRHVNSTCNKQNRKLRASSASGFIGVNWDKKNKKWKAHIKIHTKSIYLGYYITAEEAALARCHFENECPDWTCNHLAVNRVKLRSLGYKI